MRYWHIDSAEFVTLLLIDKDYYDHDYSEPKEVKEEISDMANSDDELKEKLKRIGMKVSRVKNDSAEELQRLAMELENNK